MSKEQLQEEYLKLMKERNEEANQIIEEAKEKGILKQGLDSNKELFIELDIRTKEKIKLLQSMVDEN